MHARVCTRHSLQVSHPTSTKTHSLTHRLAAGFNGCLHILWRHPKRTHRAPLLCQVPQEPHSHIRMSSKHANCGQEGIQQLGAQLATQSTDAVAGAQALMSQAMHALAREHTEIPNNIPFLLWAKISNTATPEQEGHMTQMLAQFSRGAKVPTLCRTARMQSTTTWMRLPLASSQRKGSM